MSIDKICQNIAGHINKSKGTQRVLTGIGRNPAIFSAVASFGLASVLRPLALDVLPFKNKNDRKCSKASAISSGVTDLLATTAIFIPLNKSIEKASSSLLENKGTFFEGNKEAVRQFSSITNRGAKLLFLVPLCILRMRMIKPLMNTVLRDKKEGKRKLDKWA